MSTFTPVTELINRDWSQKEPEFIREQKANEQAAKLQEIVRPDEANSQQATTVQPEVVQPTAEQPTNTEEYATRIRPEQTTESVQAPARTSFLDHVLGAGRKVVDTVKGVGDKFEQGIEQGIEKFGDAFPAPDPDAKLPELSSILAEDDGLTFAEKYDKYLNMKKGYTESEQNKEKRLALIGALGDGLKLFGSIGAAGMGGRAKPIQQSALLTKSMQDYDNLDASYMNELETFYKTLMQQERQDELLTAQQGREDAKLADERKWREEQADKSSANQKSLYEQRATAAAELAAQKEKGEKPYMEVGIGGKVYGLSEGQAREFFMEGTATMKNDPKFAQFLKDQNVDLKTLFLPYESQPVEVKKEFVQIYASYKAQAGQKPKQDNSPIDPFGIYRQAPQQQSNAPVMTQQPTQTAQSTQPTQAAPTQTQQSQATNERIVGYRDFLLSAAGQANNPEELRKAIDSKFIGDTPEKRAMMETATELGMFDPKNYSSSEAQAPQNNKPKVSDSNIRQAEMRTGKPLDVDVTEQKERIEQEKYEKENMYNRGMRVAESFTNSDNKAIQKVGEVLKEYVGDRKNDNWWKQLSNDTPTKSLYAKILNLNDDDLNEIISVLPESAQNAVKSEKNKYKKSQAITSALENILVEHSLKLK